VVLLPAVVETLVVASLAASHSALQVKGHIIHAFSVGTAGTGTKANTYTYASVKGSVSHVSGANAVFLLDATATKMVEGGVYKLVVSGVPNAENGVHGGNMNLGSLVISVGKTTAGGLGYSAAQLFNALPK